MSFVFVKLTVEAMEGIDVDVGIGVEITGELDFITDELGIDVELGTEDGAKFELDDGVDDVDDDEGMEDDEADEERGGKMGVDAVLLS